MIVAIAILIALNLGFLIHLSVRERDYQIAILIGVMLVVELIVLGGCLI